MLAKEEFEQIDIDSFFEPAEVSKKQQAEKAEIFTKRQRELLNQFMPVIISKDKEKASIFFNRIADLELMANSVAKFPSLLERHELAGGTRTPTTLTDSLIKHNDARQNFATPIKSNFGKKSLSCKNTHFV